MAIFEVLYLHALPSIVLCFSFLFVYVFHIVAFDLYCDIGQYIVNMLWYV